MRFLALLFALLAAPAFADEAQDPLNVAVPVGDIDDASMAPVSAKIDELVEAGAKTITLRINSHGGDVDAGQKFVQKLESLNRQGVHTVCIGDGDVISMGTYVLQACEERWTTKRTTFLFHQPWAQVQGNSYELGIMQHRLQVLNESLAEFIGRRLHMGAAGYKNKIAFHEWTCGYREALEAGAVDKVIEPEDIPALATLEEPKLNLFQLLTGSADHIRL